MPWPQWLAAGCRLHVSIHLWPLRLLVPFPFRYSTTHMQAVGRRPQTAPDLWSRVPGAGAREERRGGLRWYPECTQRSVPALPGPHRRKTALSQSHAHHSIHTHCRADRYAASPRNKNHIQLITRPPAEGAEVPHERETGRNSPPSSASRPVRWKLLSQPQIIYVGFATRFPGPTLAALPIAPIRAAGSHQPTPHPSSTLPGLPHSLNPPAHTHPPPLPRDAKACVSHRLLQYRAASAS